MIPKARIRGTTDTEAEILHKNHRNSRTNPLDQPRGPHLWSQGLKVA